MKIHVWLTIVLTLLIAVAAGVFSVKGYNEVITHPQFGNFDQFEAIAEKIKDTRGESWRNNGLFWYKCFFVLDFLWAACFLSLLFRWIRQQSNLKGQHAIKSKALLRYIFIFSLLAYVLDIFENIFYLCLTPQFKWLKLSTIADLKAVNYAFVFMMALIFLYQEHIFARLPQIIRSLKATFLSLLAILLLVILATFMDQGSTVIIHLLESPVNLAATILFLNMLALASAHYPDYLDKYFNTSVSQSSVTPITWILRPLLGIKTVWGMGLILYKQGKGKMDLRASTQSVNRQITGNESIFFDHFRKITGMMVMITWIYVLLYVSIKYKILNLPLGLTTVIILALFLTLYFVCSDARQYWRRYVSNNQNIIERANSGNVSYSRTAHIFIPSRVQLYLNATLISFLLLILAIGITSYIAISGSWLHTWKALMITAFINTVFIILFQHFRTVFSLFTPPKSLLWIPVYHMHKDLNFLRFFAIMGFFSLFTFVVATYNPGRINALVLILMYIYLFYGALVVLLKHHLFYSSPHQDTADHINHPKAKVFFEKYVPILGLLVILWIFFTGKAGNGLHALHPLPEDENYVVSMPEYKSRLQNNMVEAGEDTVYLVSSYGGGLRASTWTMLLLDSIQSIKPDFFQTTAAMSGVSGGFLGLSMYTALLAEHDDRESRRAKIDSIGKHNILSIDISYLLGFDFIRELIPYVDSFYFKDRAGRSMQAYASLIQPKASERKRLLETSYRQYWGTLFKHQENTFLPALIGNSTATHSRYGVAFSIGGNKHNFDTIFPGAVDILEFKNDKSISYLDATSTVERFPIFSPTAQIKGKGHFLDGGYFENSGLLSLLNFYEYLKGDTSLHLRDSTTKIIVIINSKDAYIRKVLGDTVILKNELATGEMGAILKTVADVDILPLALEAKYKIQFGKNFIPVYLPYPITYDEVVALIRGTPAFPLEIQKKINASNQLISDLLDPYKERNLFPVPPALARVLSNPAYEYMKAMLRHQEVQDAIATIR